MLKAGGRAEMTVWPSGSGTAVRELLGCATSEPDGAVGPRRWLDASLMVSPDPAASDGQPDERPRECC
ncbi:MAG TPA: hypothetical protein VFW87_24520, partial [Pirellulales bacterium]|nr:hypothetical protein [Pirellulales bacterium]